MKTLDAPLEFVRNTLPGKWSESKVSMYEDKLPDRFAVVPGRNNYRGAKISHESQVKMMKKLGVKHIISFSSNSYGNQQGEDCGGNAKPCEPQWAAKYGMTWAQYPLNKRTVLTPEEWNTIRNLMAKGGVYFHCSHGVDRTGGVAARWRLELEKDLTPDEVFYDYTYKFGGAWRHAGDPNYKHRAFVKEGQFDPALLRKVKWSINKDKVYIGLGVTVALPLLGYAIYYLMSDD